LQSLIFVGNDGLCNGGRILGNFLLQERHNSQYEEPFAVFSCTWH